jgi:hypothetical protein
MSLENPIQCNSCPTLIFFVRTDKKYESGLKKGKFIHQVYNSENKQLHQCMRTKVSENIGSNTPVAPKTSSTVRTGYHRCKACQYMGCRVCDTSDKYAHICRV